MCNADAFAIWFGRSKVVNADGSPRKVYHGTFADFDTFAAKRRNPELGFHFGSVSQAEFFAGYGSASARGPLGSVMPVYLRIERPLRVFDIFERGIRSAENIVRWLYRDGILDERLKKLIAAARSANDACRLTVGAIESIGHDGLVYANEWEGGDAENNEDSYVVFRSEQVKSVFNRGTFDRVRACILD